ncbi:MAG: Fe-S cluster assembly ATPase SufC [Candidatus Aenigmarchaeota archaeon]|nr:Fe-S cluster assembly ATPase SufC [Candidatus Aenigmarchaeota archaeon]
MSHGNNSLVIENLRVNVEGQEILKGINLEASIGEVNAIMGPNGSGKSTLAYALMGHPKYEITAGSIMFQGEDLTRMKPNERAKRGLFLSFQYPTEIPGVTVSNFLRTALNAIKPQPVPVPEFLRLLKEKMALLKVDQSFASRYLNEGFSGGEKKRTEILQLAVLQPKLAILDETDSGLDIDSLKIVAEGVNSLMAGSGLERDDKAGQANMGALVITHYQRLLNYIKPDRVHIMMDGKIVMSGGPELVHKLESHGYEWVGKAVSDPEGADEASRHTALSDLTETSGLDKLDKASRHPEAGLKS